MTPLEELQAAHKRLSELRGEEPVWTAGHDNAEVMAGSYYVASTTAEQYTDLIVTLHRTIDAQLAILQDTIREVVATSGLSGDWRVHELARAINGS